MTKKEISQNFLVLIASGKAREAFQKYAHTSCIHHNPYFGKDVDALILAMEEDALANPDKIIDFRAVIAEHDRVVVHSHIRQHKQDSGYATVHIFRFEQNKIVELWDIAQEVPQDMLNENGMF